VLVRLFIIREQTAFVNLKIKKKKRACFMEKKQIQQVNSELRTIAAEELQKAIASELAAIDDMEEEEFTKLLLEDKDESQRQDN
jgi:hypothetical protein